MTSYTKAAKEIRAMGFKVSKSEDGEIRVSWPLNEGAAYYTDCPADALGTARAMAAETAADADMVEIDGEEIEIAELVADMPETFDAICADLYAAIEGKAPADVAAQATVSGSDLNMITRRLRRYYAAQSAPCAIAAGIIGVGLITFAESRLRVFNRRAAATLAKGASA